MHNPLQKFIIMASTANPATIFVLDIFLVGRPWDGYNSVNRKICSKGEISNGLSRFKF